ncbi:MAG: hypothetical protein CXR30_00015 [Geobacter sp.]|nr:MAG: hypothetical protein CXR30_00015 [Geobacter sp.]
MTWNMKALADFVEKDQGKPQRTIAAETLFSLMWKLNIVRYHSDKSKEAISDLQEIDPTEIIGLIFEQATGSEKGKEFFKMQFASEANLIACAQSLHSMSDILGQVVYVSLNLDKALPKPINQRRRYLGVINDEMKKAALAPELTAKIDKFLSSKQFVFVSDYVNVTKHRSLVPAAYSVSFAEKSLHGLKLSAFRYDEREYEATWSNDFLDSDVKSLLEMIVEIGNEINKFLGIG